MRTTYRYDRHSGLMLPAGKPLTCDMLAVNHLAGFGAGRLGVLPGVTAFDGTGDYFDRDSDLSGNSDGGTFTFSVLYYFTNTSGYQFFYEVNDGNQFGIFFDGSQITILANNSSGTRILDVDTSISPSTDTYYHLMVSIDLSNTDNRHIRIDDADRTGSSVWNIYTDDSIDFTQAAHAAGATNSGANSMNGRLAHLFLDYTYRDLSVEANRRLFLASNGKPAAGQDRLNPILYLPMNDSGDLDKNLGNGGSFTVNGDPQYVNELPSVTI